MTEVKLPNDHWVSRAYQQNFATDERRVAIFGAQTGLLVDDHRAIRSNFRLRGFTTFLEAGVPNDLLERAFASVETRILHEIRTISPNRAGPQQKADVANLFAVHLVRSPSFKSFHGTIEERFRSDTVPDFGQDEEYRERFEASFGRPPNESELLDLALSVYDEMIADPMGLVTTMIRQHDAMAEMLNGFHLQVIELDSSLPGFVIGDTPVVHAALNSGRYGFRDELALGDADFIIGPLTRTTAACFSGQRLRHVRVTTRKMSDTINAIFMRAAQKEVACHPSDAKAVRQTLSRLDLLPPSVLQQR